MLKDAFRSAELQEEVNYGLGYKLALTRNKEDTVLNETEAIAVARIQVDNINWYVPQHYTFHCTSNIS